MHNLPIDQDRVRAARDAMRAYAGPHLTRDQAAALLEYWHGRAELTLTEVLIVLSAYKVSRMTGEHDGTKE